MKAGKLILIIVTISIAFGISFFLGKDKFYNPPNSPTKKKVQAPRLPYEEIPEINMESCRQLNISTNCVSSQVKYSKWLIISTCRNCDCEAFGHEFLQLDLTTNEISKIQVDGLDKERKIHGNSMSIAEQRLFVVDLLSNSAINFQITKSLLGPILSYKFKFQWNKDYKLRFVHALSDFEALITDESLDEEEKDSKNKTSSVFYVINNPNNKKQHAEKVDGLENGTILTGIAKNKHNKFIFGSPEDKSVNYYNFILMQGLGMQLTKVHSVEVGFKVGGIVYNEETDEAFFIKNPEMQPEYLCQGSLYSLNQHHTEDYKNVTFQQLFQAQKSICSMDSVIVHNGSYYFGSNYESKYLVCKQ